MLDVLGGEKSVGTLFIEGGANSLAPSAKGAAASDGNGSGGGGAAAEGPSAAVQAAGAKTASRALQALSTSERSAVLKAVAAALRANMEVILQANAKDLAAAEVRRRRQKDTIEMSRVIFESVVGRGLNPT